MVQSGEGEMGNVDRIGGGVLGFKEFFDKISLRTFSVAAFGEQRGLEQDRLADLVCQVVNCPFDFGEGLCQVIFLIWIGVWTGSLQMEQGR